MKLLTTLSITTTLAFAFTAQSQTIVQTDAYTWHGDTVTQGEYTAVATSPTFIQSTYHARPGYYMGIQPEWKLKNDISSYPQLETPNTMHKAIYNMALDEMVNAVEPDTTLRTGAAWGGVWTRDVSYSIILAMAYMQPEASKISLMKKVDCLGRIIQDTGSGGAWPISTDRTIWAVAAYELYKVTGDRQWLEYIYPIIKRSLDADLDVIYDPATGLARGETSFIDWREQSHPRWMQTADIAVTTALGTNAVHAKALQSLSEIAAQLGNDAEAAYYAGHARAIADAINEHLWIDEKGYYGMYLYGAPHAIMNPHAETLGEALTILWDIAPAERAKSITENNPTTPFGVGIFFPQIADMAPYHNNALWPWVASFWAIANAKAGNEQGTLEAIGSVVRPAALFCTNKENFVLDNGDIATELNSSNMLWCLSGNIALTHKILFGIGFENDRITFAPFVPQALAAERSLKGFKYRDATLDISVKGHGNIIKSFTVNGKKHEPFLPADAKGHYNIEIVMADNTPTPLNVNHMANVKAPLTPTTWFEGNTLTWDQTEYCDHYVILRDGKEVARQRHTNFDASQPGTYQLIVIGEDGTPSFASRPHSNLPTQLVEVPGVTTAAKSDEMIFRPSSPIQGFTGDGFVESDHATGAINIPVTVPEDGSYIISLRYANGNGFICTGNSAAVRTLHIDGKKAGSIIMPHRGEGKWNEWGFSTAVSAPLEKGTHLLTITIEPSNENMNITTNHALIDAVKLVKLNN